MLNHVCSVFVRLTVLSMLVFAVGATGCSSGLGSEPLQVRLVPPDVQPLPLEGALGPPYT
jgi:hypothetical protein